MSIRLYPAALPVQNPAVVARKRTSTIVFVSDTLSPRQQVIEALDVLTEEEIQEWLDH